MTERIEFLSLEDQIAMYASVGATRDELITYFELDNFEPYEKVYNKGNAEFVLNIRKAQAQLAFGGDSNMAKWLGQQNLKQQDTTRTEVAYVDAERLELENTLKNLLEHNG